MIRLVDIAGLAILIAQPIWIFIRLRRNGAMQAGIKVMAGCFGVMLLACLTARMFEPAGNGAIALTAPRFDRLPELILVLALLTAPLLLLLPATHLLLRRFGR